MLKFKLDKAAYDKLEEAQKALYAESSGEYVLKVEGYEDPAELKRAKDREVQARKEAERRAQEAESKLESETGINAKKRGDIETLEKSWNEKNEKQKKEYEEKLTKKDQFITNSLIDGETAKLAAKISNNTALITPHIKSRISVDLSGDMPQVKVLDKDGKPSAMTLDDLEKEFVANKDFSSIIIGSKASGSGAPKDNKQGFGGGAPVGADGKPKSFSEMTPPEKAAYITSKKEAQTT